MRKLEDLEIYSMSMNFGEKVWSAVSQWDFFNKSTIGIQWVRSSDSIAANLAEGYGRNSNKEVLQYCYYSRGSLKETVCFLQKSYSRSLVTQEFYNEALVELEVLGKKLNSYINYLRSH
jgi:four helix bundle protein